MEPPKLSPYLERVYLRVSLDPFHYTDRAGYLFTPDKKPLRFDLDFLAREMKRGNEQKEKIQENEYLIIHWMIEYLHRRCPRPFLLATPQYQGNFNEYEGAFLIGTKKDVFLKFNRKIRTETVKKERGPTIPESRANHGLDFYLGHDTGHVDKYPSSTNTSGIGYNIHYQYYGVSVNDNLKDYFHCLEEGAKVLDSGFFCENHDFNYKTIIPNLLREALCCTEVLKDWKRDDKEGLILPEEYRQYCDFIRRLREWKWPWN